jgi:hypothetical protein
VIDSYIELKNEEVQRLRLATNPIEFDLYYSCSTLLLVSWTRRPLTGPFLSVSLRALFESRQLKCSNQP